MKLWKGYLEATAKKEGKGGVLFTSCLQGGDGGACKLLGWLCRLVILEVSFQVPPILSEISSQYSNGFCRDAGGKRCGYLAPRHEAVVEFFNIFFSRFHGLVWSREIELLHFGTSYTSRSALSNPLQFGDITCLSRAFLTQSRCFFDWLACSTPSGWAVCISKGHDIISKGYELSTNVTLFSSAHLLRENTDSVRSNQLMRPTAPSVPLKLKRRDAYEFFVVSVFDYFGVSNGYRCSVWISIVLPLLSSLVLSRALEDTVS
ncbi:hypothetical protein Tco_0744849 [Tanacetum coccineum]